MKLCSVTNYIEGTYVNEFLIFNKLSSLLGITKSDSFNFKNLNSIYYINKNYTHLIIYFDHKILSPEECHIFLREINIPKIFIVDTIPEKHKEINFEIEKELFTGKVNSFVSLPIEHQEFLYNEYADGLIFFNEFDKNIFSNYYNIKESIPKKVIPPPLGKKEDLQINFNNLSPNKLMGYNGVPSHANGFSTIKNYFNTIPGYFLDIFGVHGRTSVNNEHLINNILDDYYPNIRFRGKLKDFNKFFKLYHIYLNLSIYDSFDYFTFLSLLNGMVPIINQDSGTSLYFKSYPFKINSDSNSFKYTVNLINNTPTDYLKDILENTLNEMPELENENVLLKYKTFLNGF